VLFPAFFVFYMWRFIKRALDQHPELLEAQTLRFGAAGLSITNSVASLQWPWNRVHSVSEGTDFILLRLDSLGSGAPRKNPNARIQLAARIETSIGLAQ